jgi:thiol-disulfide isomerase/thioredoxin
MRILLLTAAVLSLAACHQKSTQQQSAANESAAESGASEGIKGVHRQNKGKPIPDVNVLDAMGHETKLASLQDGRPLLVNLWASWCAPCVKELPTLQQLRNQRGGRLIVLPINQDMGPQKSVEAFLNDHKLNFVAYQDPKMALSGALGAEVLPTTVLYDANGKEVWRYVGDLDWTSPEAAKLLSEAAAPKAG